MSKHLAASEAVALLENLKATGRDFAARAEKLHGDFRIRTLKEQKRREAALEEQAQELAAARTQADVAFQKTKEAAEKMFQARKTRIGRAYQSSKELALQKIEDRIGGRKYEMQKKMLQAERDRETSLGNAATALKDFKANLAIENERLGHLEVQAQRSFKGYLKFGRIFRRAYEKPGPDGSGDENELFAELRGLIDTAEADLRRFRGFALLRLFKFMPAWAFLLLCVVAAVPALQYFGINSFSYEAAAGCVIGGAILIGLIRFAGGRKALPVVNGLSGGLARARRLHDICFEKSDVHFQQEIERIKNEFLDTTERVDLALKDTVSQAGQLRVGCRMKSDEKAVRAGALNDRLQLARRSRIEKEYEAEVRDLQQAAEARSREFTAAAEQEARKSRSDYEAQWQALQAEWKSKVEPMFAVIKDVKRESDRLFPPWPAPVSDDWQLPPLFEQAARFAQLEVDTEKLCDAKLADQQLLLPGPSRFPLPLLLTYPREGSVLFETAQTGHAPAIGALNNIILRLLSVSPPGRLNFTILDPVGLGQNFAGVMHLADYEEQIIHSRIWTQSGQIEQRLADLNEHMEKVIQMYLRNEYATISEYNEQAGVIAEKYHFLVVADFPSAFTDVAAKRLLSIASSGARCGVYTLIHWDTRQPLPADFVPGELRKSSVSVTFRGNALMLTGKGMAGADLVLDDPPDPETAIRFVHKVGQASRDSSRVEVPFEQVAPAAGELWSSDTTTELRVAIGRTGATKLQYLAIGKGTRQHGLVAGKTGSGKSTLFHVVITNLALWCSPDQVEFYLVDFKKGVEFKCYAARRLPHARVVAIESDREFALSVLQRVDDELKRRGDMFRKLGVQDIAGYKRAGGKEAIPRTLLIVDEFQEFFVEDDKIAQTASLLLDRIVRQGRAFGIHVLLGSQTLGGAYTVARTTLGQMVIRIALQCNEADAYLIMDDTNPAPRLLSRPGEGIYNDTAGTVEGNSPFQVVWLPDDVRETYLDKVRARADSDGVDYEGPIVFEGNAPADVRENLVLGRLLTAESVKTPAAPRIWLGAPNSIKGPTEATFHRQSGNNLLLVGQRDEATLAILSVALVSLAAQYPPGASRIIVCDGSPPDSPPRQYLERVIQAIPHNIILAKPGDLGDLLKGLNDEMKQRGEDDHGTDSPATFLLIHGLQKFNKLRYEEEFGFAAPDENAPPNPALLLNNLICEGTRLGFHVIATCDTYNNVNRFLSRKAFSEFEMRVLFQMSANDSASLIDNPKASILGMHRALYFNEQEGYLETFRPYALPGNDWIEEVAGNLKRLATPVISNQ